MKAIHVYFNSFDPSINEIDFQVVYDNAGTKNFANGMYYYTSDQSYEAIRQGINAWIITNAPSAMTEADILYPLLMPGSAPRAFANPSRTINSAFQISATRDAMAFYSVSIPTALSLTGGENGAVVLEYADDSGISTNVVTVGTVRNGNTGTLTLGLNTLASMGCQVSGMIPAGKYARLRPVDTTGSPVQAFVSAQEVLI